MILTLDIISIIILYGAVQGLLLTYALSRSPESAGTANRILMLFVLLISMVLFSRLIYVEGTVIWQKYPHLFLIPDIPMFMYGPLLYFYFVSRLTEIHISWKRAAWHFLPAAVHLLILLSYLPESSETYLRRLQTADLWEYPTVNLIAFLQLTAYWVASVRLLSQFRASHERPAISFPTGHLWAFLTVVLVSLVAWSYKLATILISGLPGRDLLSENLVWIVLSLNPAILAAFAMTRQSLFQSFRNRKKYDGSRLSNQEIARLANRLNHEMRQKKPYLDSQLKLQQLADQIQIHPKVLSQTINQHFGMNFSDYVNEFRVEAFKERYLQNGNIDKSILAIALESGFNSKTTFNTAFKKSTGQSPKEFIRSLS